MAESPEHSPEETPIRPTLRTIAKKAGLSLAATSMALRNHPGVAAKTRVRVQALAREIGYHPDPKLATLMQHLRLHKGVDYRETIAFLSSYANYEEWKVFSQHDYYLGACERAAELGYRVELFHLAEKGMTPNRMSRMLEARGIRGVLVGGFSKPGATLKLEWEKFAAVTFGYSLTMPVLNRVTTDYYREMLSVLGRLTKEGCRRIGLNLSINADVKVLNFWRSAYLLFEDNLPKGAVRVPVNASMLGAENLATWLQEHKPDAVVSAGCDFPRAYERAYGKAPPKRIRYVNMNLHHADGRSRGIDQDSWAIGRLGCGHLVTMLQRNEIGLPEEAQIISIEGNWVENYDEWLQALGDRTKPEALLKKR